MIDLENVEPSIEGLSDIEDLNDIKNGIPTDAKPLGKIPAALKDRIGRLSKNSHHDQGDKISISGYPISHNAELLGMEGHILEVFYLDNQNNEGKEGIEKQWTKRSDKKYKHTDKEHSENDHSAYDSEGEAYCMMVYEDVYTSSGQSGAPIMKKTNKGWSIIGVHRGSVPSKNSKSLIYVSKSRINIGLHIIC